MIIRARNKCKNCKYFGACQMWKRREDAELMLCEMYERDIGHKLIDKALTIRKCDFADFRALVWRLFAYDIISANELREINEALKERER